jgi:hypothetical protein
MGCYLDNESAETFSQSKYSALYHFAIGRRDPTNDQFPTYKSFDYE